MKRVVDVDTGFGPNSTIAYKYEREERELKRPAFTWEQILSEVRRAIGHEDARAWLDSISDILENAFFERDPVFFADPVLAEQRMKIKHPEVLGHTWVSPHPEAWHKLGYYRVWRADGTMSEVFGETEVRTALLENTMKQSKL